MKQFDIPVFYRSPIISKVKEMRKITDPRKKDFTPTMINFGPVHIYIARHFGFCYGVENAIEISYRAIEENKGKRIFLLSQMIHNPDVNNDLTKHGIEFLQDTMGNQLIPFETLNADDVVIIPAFGTTLSIMDRLTSIGVDIQKYDTTCPFVEKVWNRSEKLGKDKHAVIIHGKHQHEETRATFSHASEKAPAVVVKNLKEAQLLADVILGKRTTTEFFDLFNGKHSPNFDPEKDLEKVGVVNQTTMLASETQEIADFIRATMVEKYGQDEIKAHFADTRDTLCYATNDNQNATLGLLETDADLAVIVGGYNSSNTTHLVELLEAKFPSYFIKNESEIIDKNNIQYFDIHKKSLETSTHFLPEKEPVKIIVTAGASCPDAMVDAVIQRILSFYPKAKDIEEALKEIN